MSHGLRAAISSLGSVSRGVAFQREEKTLLRRGNFASQTKCAICSRSSRPDPGPCPVPCPELPSQTLRIHGL